MMWRHVAFDHPATFDTLAMDPEKKKDIVDDLIAFTKGTGKSTMIAAMANFLHFDVYDLELTAIKDNTELRKLMIEIPKGEAYGQAHRDVSYCCFEAFKVLAKNYLKLESHEKFENIKCLLKEIDISPADVAENLMPKSPEMSAEECLENLITALHQAKEEAASRKAKNLDAETEDKESEVKQQSGTASKEEVKTGFRKMMLRILAEKYNCFR
ncbi:AAA-ATPase [Sesamum angolense]|uniref:AAA-ATPase n=1 Tax=Sesamum angolense TaxID=2727404 RepID=A0AAE1T509_9LAMI|nr:AAA-ATPase [Sesamum angolense]